MNSAVGGDACDRMRVVSYASGTREEAPAVTVEKNNNNSVFKLNVMLLQGGTAVISARR